LPSTSRITRVFGIPNGLVPSTHFSLAFIWSMRSARVNTLRVFARRLFRFKLLSMDTLIDSSLSFPSVNTISSRHARRHNSVRRKRHRRILQKLIAFSKKLEWKMVVHNSACCKQVAQSLTCGRKTARPRHSNSPNLPKRPAAVS
jgi:hypothetical protein